MTTANMKNHQAITNPLFRECLAQVSDEASAEANLSFESADRIDALITQKN